MYRLSQVLGIVPQPLCRGGSILGGGGIVLDDIGNLVHADGDLFERFCLLHCRGGNPLDHCRRLFSA